MKRALTIVLALVFTICFTACEKAPFITMTGPRTFTFTRDGGTQTFTFSCNRDWSASSTESWIKVSPASGKASDGDITVTITCSPNAAYDARSATVTVKLAEISESLTITQDTGIGLIVSPATFTLTNAAQDIEIEVQKNVQYSIAIDEAGVNWIKAGGTKALSLDKITFHIAANDTYDDREGKITFKQTDGPLSETVTIKQSQLDGLFITTSTYDLSNAEQTLSVEVKANVGFEVASQAEWIKPVETKALSTTSILLQIESNTTTCYRTGTVMVQQKDGDLSQRISITQQPTPLIETKEASEVGIYTARLNGLVTVESAGSIVQEVFFLIGKDAKTIDDLLNSGTKKPSKIEENGAFYYDLSGLEFESSYYYVACARVHNKDYYGSVCSFETPVGLVDLGLSVLWATFNIGAKRVEDYGDYYAWGEIEPKMEYGWNNYKWCNGTSSSITKYCINSYQGKVDGKRILEKSDDVATVLLGEKWRMPTEQEMNELINNCTWTISSQNEVSGYSVKSNENGKEIFIPFAGFWMEKELCNTGISSFYWTSSLNQYSASALLIQQINYFVSNCGRYSGCPIRPIHEK